MVDQKGRVFPVGVARAVKLMRTKEYLNSWFQKLMREKEYLNSWFQWLRSCRSPILHKIHMAFWYAAWRKSLQIGRNPLTDEAPWINFEVRSFIESVLTAESIVFEYGSGGSTLFYSKRAKRVFSVEHEPDWFERVKSALTERGFANCDLVLIPPERANSTETPENWEAYISTDEHYKGYSFCKYVASIDSFPEEFFDFVAIDGRARQSCIYHARPKVKVGGFLMLDDSDRPQYQRAKGLLSDWAPLEFYGPIPYHDVFSQATIWKRLKSSRV